MRWQDIFKLIFKLIIFILPDLKDNNDVIKPKLGAGCQDRETKSEKCLFEEHDRTPQVGFEARWCRFVTSTDYRATVDVTAVFRNCMMGEYDIIAFHSCTLMLINVIKNNKEMVQPIEDRSKQFFC